MLTIRSFAAAAFIAGHGIEPVGGDPARGWIIFADPEAEKVFRKYMQTVERLTALQDHVKASTR